MATSLEEKIIAWSALAVAVVLLINLCCITTFNIPAFSVIVFLFPPLLFFGNVNRGFNQRAIWVTALGVMLYCGIAAAYALQYLRKAEYLVGESANLWMEMVRSAGVFYLLPLYFGSIRPDPEGENVDTERAVNGPHIVALPGGVFVAISFLPGSLMGTVVRSKEFRASALAYCSYVFLSCCTVAAAAAAASLELVTVDTALAYLVCMSLVSLGECFLCFFNPEMNTDEKTGFTNQLCSAVLIASGVFVMDAVGFRDLYQVGAVAYNIRRYVLIALIPTVLWKVILSGGVE